MILKVFLVFIKFSSVSTALSISAAKLDPIFWFEPEFRLDFRVLPGRALKVKMRVGSGRPQNGYKFRFKPNPYLINPIEPDFGLGPKLGQLRSAPGVKVSMQ